MIYGVFAVVFGLACWATALYSASFQGIGPWSLLTVGIGFLVLLSAFFDALRAPARGLALAMAILSGAAVGLLFIAGSVGGSFNMSDPAALILIGSVVIFVLSIGVFLTGKRTVPP